MYGCAATAEHVGSRSRGDRRGARGGRRLRGGDGAVAEAAGDHGGGSAEAGDLFRGGLADAGAGADLAAGYAGALLPVRGAYGATAGNHDGERAAPAAGAARAAGRAVAAAAGAARSDAGAALPGDRGAGLQRDRAGLACGAAV